MKQGIINLSKQIDIEVIRKVGSEEVATIRIYKDGSSVSETYVGWIKKGEDEVRPK